VEDESRPAQSAQKKPLVIGLTMDTSGQYAASGADEHSGR
jgi:branched-chain amino acid transport system substrate-binding protein